MATPVFLPGESEGQRSLVGCHLWGCTKSDTTDMTQQQQLHSMDFLCGSAGKESTCNAGDLGSVSGLGRSPGEGKGYLLQYSGLENSMGYIVHGVAKSQTRLSNFNFIPWMRKLGLGKDKQMAQGHTGGDRAEMTIPDF